MDALQGHERHAGADTLGGGAGGLEFDLSSVVHSTAIAHVQPISAKDPNTARTMGLFFIVFFVLPGTRSLVSSIECLGDSCHGIFRFFECMSRIFL